MIHKKENKISALTQLYHPISIVNRTLLLKELNFDSIVRIIIIIKETNVVVYLDSETLVDRAANFEELFANTAAYGRL